MGERKATGRYHTVNDDRAIDSPCDHGHIPKCLYCHVGWFVLSVLPDVLFEEGHVLQFTGALTFETDMDQIVGKE